MVDTISRSLFGFLAVQGARFPLNVDPIGRSPGKQLLDAILENNAKEVEALLQHGVDPNVTLGLLASRSVSPVDESSNGKDNRMKVTPEILDDYAANMDKIFLWKKFFGDAPTPVHVAVLNIYHQNQYRRALERALQILGLLLRYGGDVTYASHNIFMRPDRLIETSPIDLATGIQRMAMMTMLEKAEAAIVKAADIMRSHVDDKKLEVKRHRIPFELVSLVSLQKTLDFLYISEGKRRASASNLNIRVITSDGSRILMKNHENCRPNSTGR